MLLSDATKALSIMKHSTGQIATCQTCDKVFKLPKKDLNVLNHYCSPECKLKSKTYEYKCSGCGITFTRKLFSKSKNVFCCESCRWKHTTTIAKAKKPKRPNWGFQPR